MNKIAVTKNVRKEDMKNIRKKAWITVLFNFLLLTFLVIFQACGSSETVQVEKNSPEEASVAETHQEVVQLTPEEMSEFGIELAIAGSAPLHLHRDLTGEISTDPERLAHIVPRFPGIVIEVRKQIGDVVKKGEVLAIIESNESLAPYEVKSLIDGTVIEMHLTRGEMISDATHAFVIADLSYVWANLNVYQKDLPYIKVGQKASIAGIEMEMQYNGEISYISPVVDEVTRTATARVIIPNSDRKWRPGMFITAKVITEAVNPPVVVPKTAIQTLENQPVIFIQTEEGFKPQPVTLGRMNDKYTEIIAGLTPGQRYVSLGGFTIKAELQKEAFGDDH